MNSFRHLIIALFLTAFSAAFVAAQDTSEPAATPALSADAIGENAQSQPILDVTDEKLTDFLWQNRLLVVFADSPNDPQYRLQMDLLTQRLDVLGLRDVVVLTDTTPSARSAPRLELRPRGFMLVGIDKDGRILFRKPAPWDVREISRSIDKSPIRLQEVEDARLIR